MDHVEELRRVVRGYREKPPLKTPPGLLDSIHKLDTELGPGKRHLPAGGSLEQDLRDVAGELVKKGGVSNVAGTLLHGILGQLATPGRPSTVSTAPAVDDARVIDAQPLSTGQIPTPYTGHFPDPS